MSAHPIAALAVLFSATIAAADDPKLPDAKAFDKLVVDSLRDVHNAGADLYNMSKDFTGTYRMYQGALLTVRPLLAHRPAAQKIIDDGIAASDKETGVAQKAFKLHEAIEGVRSLLKGETVKKDEKKPEGKKPEGKKPPEDKNPRPAPTAFGSGPGFRGTVTFKGKPLAGGDVIFVSLDQPKPRVFAATIQDNGQYAPMEVVPPGKYVVVVQGKGVPEKYQLTTTSGLTADVGPPPSVFDIALQ